MNRLIAIAVLAALCSVVALLFGPTILWAYDIQQAGAAMERGMRWPEPRRSDSLPLATDDAALDDALTHLAAAQRWRAGDGYAFRLAGQVYAARQDWAQAAEAYEQAHALASAEPLVAWETSLIYEQMQRVIDAAPVQPVFDAFANGQLSAPGQLVRSPFCSDRGAETCYYGRLNYTMGEADNPKSRPITRDVVFLHPPASLNTTITVPQNAPMLQFVIGLDPAVRDWNSDGATFRVIVRSGNTPTTAGELQVDAATARLGWVHGVANLQPWAGQSVEISIVSDPGPAGDPTDDWYGWSDLSFTAVDAARFVPLYPHKRMLELWRSAGQNEVQFSRRRDEARDAGQTQSAQAWEWRVQQLQIIGR